MKNYVTLGFLLLFGALTGYAQCNPIDAGENRTIVCGDSIYIQGQPKWSNGLDSTASYFRSVFFTDSITGYTVGDNGVIHKTINGGTTWTSQTSGVTNNLQSVVFTSATTGYVVGENGLILKTINGGTNWTAQTSGTTNTLYSVYFTDANTGIAAGANGVILKTINAGLSWLPRKSNLATNLISVHFANTSVGYVTCEGKIIKTIDGGETWKVIQNIGGNLYIRIYFTNINTGYVTLRDFNGANSILKTTDGGVNWTSLNVSSTYAFSSLFFTDAKTGYAGSVGKIFKTNDAGITWESQDVNLMNVEDIYFPTAKTGYAVGYGTAPKNTLKYTFPDLIQWSPLLGLSSPNIINPIVSPTTTTTYILTTKTGTCIQKDSIKITVAPLTVDAGNNQKMICGGSVQLIGVASNSTGKLQYSWLPKTGLSDATVVNPIVTIKQTTTYTLTVKTPNGCTASGTVKITVDSLLANAGTDKTITCGGSVQLPAVISNYTGSGVLTYSWLPTTGLNSSTIADPVSEAIKETNYRVIVTTPNGCKATDSVKVVVAPLKASAGSDKMLICGGSVQLDAVNSNYPGAGKLSYSWIPTTGINNSTSMNPLVTIAQPEIFQVTVTTPNGCMATDSVRVDVKPLTVYAGADKLHACGESIKFDDVKSNYTGTAALTYSWLPIRDLNNATIANPIATGGATTYTLTVSTQNGCKASDEVNLNLNKKNALEICMVGTDDSTGKNKIIWNHPGTVSDAVQIFKENGLANFVKIGEVPYAKGEFVDSSSQPGVKSDRYKISILDSCGLESTQSKAHKTMYLSVSKGTNGSWILKWEIYEGFATSTYFIYRGKDKSNLQLYGSASGSGTQLTFTDLGPISGIVYYQVEVKNPNPCDVDGATIRSNVSTGSAVGINEVLNTINFSVYPNPANDQLTINLGNGIKQNLTLTIYNEVGAVVKTVSIQQNEQRIDVSDLNNGFYIVELKSTDGRSVKKLTIEK